MMHILRLTLTLFLLTILINHPSFSTESECEVVVNRGTKAYDKMKVAGSTNLDLNLLLHSTNITSVDLSQLLPRDLERLGIKAEHKKKAHGAQLTIYRYAFRGVLDGEQTLKNLTFRISDRKTYWLYETCINRLIQQGVYVTVIFEEFDGGLVDDFFQHRSIPTGIYKRLLAFTSLMEVFQGDKKRHLNSRLGAYIVWLRQMTNDGNNWTYVEDALNTYDDISSDPAVWLINARDNGCCSHKPYHPMIYTFLKMAMHPRIKETYIQVMKLRLNFGCGLFCRAPESTEQENWDTFGELTHGDTQSILTALRAFIPDFVDEDYYPVSAEQKVRPLLYTVSDIYGRRNNCHNSSRQDVFMDFAVALGTYEAETQLPRLHKLLSLLSIKHLEEYETSCGAGFRAEGGFITPIIQALEYLHDCTLSLPAESFNELALFVKSQHPEFNPLSKGAGHQFSEVLTAWKQAQ